MIRWLRRRLLAWDSSRAAWCNDLECVCAICRVEDCPCEEANRAVR